MIEIQTDIDGLSEARLRRFVAVARKAVGIKARISLLLTSDAEMQRLNRQFRGKNKPTDVLSFPAVTAVAERFAGDLAISTQIAAANALRLGHSLEDEIRVLILHGLLHLAGYDHEADEGQMARKELRLRRQLGLPSTLIERSSDPKAMPKRTKPRNGRRKRRAR